MKYGELTLGQTEALVNKAGGMDGVMKVLSGEWIIGPPVKIAKRAASASRKVLSGLLELTGESMLLTRTIRFVACDKFKVDRKGELPISYLGDNFKNNFLDVVEEQVKHCRLKQRKLLKSSVDGPILSALGGEDKAKIALANAYEFLKTADRKPWYIFYIADKTGKVWAVDAYWRDGGWDVGAYPVSDPREWRDGRVVVSR